MTRLIIIALTTIALLSPQPARGQKIDAILAVVNGEAITKSDVDRLMMPISRQYQATYSGTELETRLQETRDDLLSQLIEDKLMLQKAQKEGIEADRTEIEQLIGRLRANFQSDTEFEQALDAQGITLLELRKRYEDQLLIRNVVDTYVMRRIVVSPAEVLSYYQDKQDNLQTPAQAHLRNIFIATEHLSAEREKAARDKVYDIYDQLLRGVEFLELVEKFSEAPNIVNGGDMGIMKQGTMRQEIETQVFSLPEGSFSKPIQTPLGFYIFKVEKIIPPAVPAFDEIKQVIHQQLFQDKSRRMLQTWIDELKNTAVIEVKHARKEKS